MGIRLADLSADLREHYEERAAIIEFDAGMPRVVAETRALRETEALLVKKQPAKVGENRKR